MARPFPRAARGRVVIAAVLVAAAVVLAGVVAWAAGEEAAQDEAASVEARLGAQLRAATAEFTRELDEAERLAATLAASPRVQQALAERERSVLRRLAAEGDAVAIVRGERVLAGTPPGDERPSVAAELLARTGVGIVLSASGEPIDEAAG